jgi:glucosamine--fructose-6-phosphate aminotransferase (isomerizing)
MFKEIREQPEALERILASVAAEARSSVEELCSGGLGMIYLTGSGTSYNACLAANYALSSMTRIPSSTIPASEFSTWIGRTQHPGVALIAISQSGESADVLSAVDSATHSGMRTIGISNTPGSTLVQNCDFQLISRAGPEKALTATKSFTGTLLAVQLLILELVRRAGGSNLELLVTNLTQIPRLVERSIRLCEETTHSLATKFKEKEFFFLLGSGPNYATALEGALKMKESCNLYAEGFATREFLHGPLQLVDNRTPVLLLEGGGHVEDTLKLANSFERLGAPVIIIHPEDVSVGGTDIQVAGGVNEIFLPFVHVIPLQLYAYYSSIARGLDPDNPPKLRKVVK